MKVIMNWSPEVTGCSSTAPYCEEASDTAPDFDLHIHDTYQNKICESSARGGAWEGCTFEADAGTTYLVWMTRVNTFNLTYLALTWVAEDYPDEDGDGIGDVSDNCTWTPNPDQSDWDWDGTGNPCDASPGVQPIAASVPALGNTGLSLFALALLLSGVTLQRRTNAVRRTS